MPSSPIVLDFFGNVWECRRVEINAAGVAGFLSNALGSVSIAFTLARCRKSELGFEAPDNYQLGGAQGAAEGFHAITLLWHSCTHRPNLYSKISNYWAEKHE